MLIKINLISTYTVSCIVLSNPINLCDKLFPVNLMVGNTLIVLNHTINLEILTKNNCLSQRYKKSSKINYCTPTE